MPFCPYYHYGRFVWTLLLLALTWTVASSFSVGNKKNDALQITQVKTPNDWKALADMRYDEWIRDSGDTSRPAFHMATVEIYYDERPNSVLVLARLNNKVVGAGEISPVELENVIRSPSDDDVKALYITDVVTDSNYRRRGIGQSIIQALEEEAVKQGSKYIVLHVMPDNQPALDFYERLGFEKPDTTLSSILDYQKLAENACAEGQVLLSKSVLK